MSNGIILIWLFVLLFPAPEISICNARFLSLHDLHVEQILWVDDVVALNVAMSLIEECKVVGVDCEWKPNYVKGSKPNKVASFCSSLFYN